ncbi:hypothetical protein BUL40_10345 [Croceivirga radicis]|uniref:Uncharacterized protein n=1 Tax=Croceivirga radicis TaxID=1929488 RepID=A0A1V6LQR4_9FLAO|nr:hypothetical protein [Croceivirga radicis]OQD42512.1 hypothetical protein BUL40_10345 [Croceivirga radicis]
MHFSIFYKLGSRQPNLDFVDIKLNTDNTLFIDPRLIESQNTHFCVLMQKRIEVFWGELIKSVKAKDTKRVYYLLSGLKEPNETRLGYAFSTPKGNSVAAKLKPKIVDAIQRNKAVQSGILSHFSDVELFIEDIGSDRISDITTKIIKEVLIEFTQEQCKLHNIPTVEVLQDDIFDMKTHRWVRRKVNLPVYFGKPILLVPKNIVRLENSAGHNIGCFYRFAIRNFIVHDKDMLVDVSPSGKDGEILLRDVQSKYPLSKGSLNNWVLKYGPLLVDYKTDYLKGRIRPLTDDEIMAVIYDDDISIAS